MCTLLLAGICVNRTKCEMRKHMPVFGFRQKQTQLQLIAWALSFLHASMCSASQDHILTRCYSCNHLSPVTNLLQATECDGKSMPQVLLSKASIPMVLHSHHLICSSASHLNLSYSSLQRNCATLQFHTCCCMAILSAAMLFNLICSHSCLQHGLRNFEMLTVHAGIHHQGDSYLLTKAR